MLTLLALDVLSPPWGMLSSELGLLPLLAIGCLLGAPLMHAQLGGLLRHPTPLTAVDRPHPRSNTDRQPLKQVRPGLFVWTMVCQVGWLH